MSTKRDPFASLASPVEPEQTTEVPPADSKTGEPESATVAPNAGEAITESPENVASESVETASGRVPTRIRPIPAVESELPGAPSVPGYEILGVLGKGGMGIVYRARQARLRRVVALKMIRDGSLAEQDDLTRFQTEAEALATLQHPNIVQIYEVGERDGLPFFSLEFVEGGSLAQKLVRTPQPARWSAEMLETLARAVAAAHEKGIIHRDLKPVNVLLTPDGTPKVTDFGLAKQLDQDSGQTRSGAVMGTPAYMAPEQAQGQVKHVGPLSDVWALGVILYEMLTGRVPFLGESMTETMMLVYTTDPVPPRQLQPKVPRDLETICLKCLQKEPRKRYASAAALADDLRRFLNGEPILARPISRVERLFKWTKRHPSLTALIVLVHLALVGIVAAAVAYILDVQADFAREQEARAAVEKEHAAVLVAQQQAERHLIDLTVFNGMQMVDSGDLLDSVPWLVRALQLETQRTSPDPTQVRLHRLRIGSVLHLCPHMLQVLFHPTRVNWADMSSDGRFIVTACGDGKAHLFDAETGGVLQPALEHQGRVLHAAFNAQGDRVVTASGDRSLCVWDVQTRKQVWKREHKKTVTFATFSPDGKRVVSASDDRTAQVWDAATGTKVGAVLQHQGPVRRATFSPDGLHVATASDDHTARLWNVATGEALEPVLRHKDVVRWVTFSPDGKWVATASDDNTARLWDAQTLQEIRTLPETAPVLFISFAPDNKHLVTAGDNNARLWDAQTGQRIGAELKHASTVNSAEFHVHKQTGRLLIATASDDNTARVWDAETGAALSPPLRHNGSVYRAMFDPTRPHLLTASTDGTARVWAASDNTVRGPRLQHEAPLTAAVFSPNGRLVLTATSKGDAWLWDTESGKRLDDSVDHRHRGRINAAIFSPDGRYFATAGADHVARIWDVASQQQVGPDLSHDEACALAYSSDSRWLVTGSADGTARLWEVPTGRRLAEFQGHEGRVHSVVFSADGRFLVTAGADHRARIWQTADPHSQPHVLQHGDEVYQASFSPDGRRVVTASADRTARVWNAATGQPLRVLLRHTGKVVGATFDREGARILTASDDNTARVWNAATGLPLTPPLRHGGSVQSAIFSPNGKWVATASDDDTARVWNAENGSALTPLLPHHASVIAVGFGPTGDTLLTGSADRTGRIWKLPSEDCPLEELVLIAKLYSGGWLDNNDCFVALSTEELEAVWKKIRNRYGAKSSRSRP